MCPFQHELPVPRSRGDDEGRPLEFALRGLEMVTVVCDHDVAGRLKYVFIFSFKLAFFCPSSRFSCFGNPTYRTLHDTSLTVVPGAGRLPIREATPSVSLLNQGVLDTFPTRTIFRHSNNVDLFTTSKCC